MTFNAESAHATHDSLLIASFAAGDAAAPDRTLAERRIRECADCRALHDDLIALRGAMAAVPRVATAPRDFRISAEQAERLRGGSWWHRLARAIVAPRGVGRPLATAFTTLGLVGLLIGSLPIGALSLGGPAFDRTNLQVTSQEGGGSEAPAPEANPDDAYAHYGPASGSGSGRGEDTGQPAATQIPDLVKDDGAGGTAEVPAARDLGATSQLSPVVALALGFLIVGLALFGLRRFGRRLT